LMATLAATSPLLLVHISADDFTVEEERPAGSRRQPPQQEERRGSASASLQRRSGKAEVPQPPSTPAVPERFEEGNFRVTMKPDLLTLLRIAVDARLPGVGSLRTRILVILRDAGSTSQAVVAGMTSGIEAVLGPAFAGLCPVQKLSGLAGGLRQRALAPLRAQLQREVKLISEASSSSSAFGQLPSIETLKRVFGHFYDRLTLAGEKPVLASSEFTTSSRTGEVLGTLLDEAEAQASGHLLAVAFPVSEASSSFAQLKAQEKRLLEGADGCEVDDAKIAELSSQLRALEKKRRALLAEPPSALVRFFVEAVLSGSSLRHAKVAEFGQYLAAWKNPRMAPLVDRRRSLLDERLQLSQDRQSEDPSREEELDALAKRLADSEQAIEQLNISIDCFWAELAAISDLTAELQEVGVRPPLELPDPARLKRFYAEWAWTLKNPVQLLHGSPLQCAGQFLVDVLKDLGEERGSRDLFVISVIGIQSSAKSTLLNYLFGCGFQTAAGRCTRGLYCSLMKMRGRMLLILDTEGLMSLEAEGGDVFDAQLALMAMACSHVVLINHKGELSRQLQDLLEVCLFAMQHLRVTKLQPKMLFVLRDQHDRSHSVHADALRLMRKHLAEASNHLSLRLDELIALDPKSIFLLPSAFASDLEPNTGREVRWSTDLFAQEALRLRQKIFFETSRPSATGEDAPEFSTLPDWCLHAMSVWRVLDRYGPNLLHYKTIQEIELQRELEDIVKQISAQLVQGPEGLAEQSKALLTSCTQRLSEGQASEQVDTEFRSSLQALLDRASTRGQAELERSLQARKSKFPDVRKEEAKRKLQTPVEYQGELTRYTWTLCIVDAVDRDQLRALKVHFKKTIEELWRAQTSQTIAEEKAKAIFVSEWKAFEDKCRERFSRTAKSRKQLAEEVCLMFNHALRQHRHGDESLHVVELVPPNMLLSQEPILSWPDAKVARQFLEIRNPQRLLEQTAPRPDRPPDPRRAMPVAVGNKPQERLEAVVVPQLRARMAPVVGFELAEGSTTMPSEEAVLHAMRRLNESVHTEESRYLAQLGVRFQGGRVAFLNASHLCLRYSVLNSLVRAEEQRLEHQWKLLQSHRARTEEEFLSMAQRHTSDVARAKTLADLFFDALAREWLDETLVAVAADIRAQCLADMPDASGAAERAYQQAFVERNWEEVLEYVLDVNAYLHKIFSTLFEDRKVSITRVQRPQLAAKLGSLFDALAAAAHRWGHRAGGKRTKLSSFQATLRELAAEARASGPEQQNGHQASWPLLSQRFPVVADFEVEDPERFAHELGLQVASRLGEAQVEDLVAERLEVGLQKQQAQVWALIRGCSGMCPCCGSKCDRVDSHTVHHCGHHLLPAFNGWRVAGTCEAALDTCKSAKNHQAPKRSDYSDHLFPNLEEYLKAEHPEWLPFPKEDRELLADSVLKAAWVNCRAPLLHRYDMVDSTPAEWLAAYEEPHRKLKVEALEEAEERLSKYGYTGNFQD